MKLTHLDEKGRARMVEIGHKKETDRVAIAEGTITMKPATLELILDGSVAKGDVLQTARLAGIMASKKTPELIPLCHQILISSTVVDLEPDSGTSTIKVRATVSTTGKTGVEMDALTAVSVAALTIYDMCKAVDKDMVISDIMLIEKTGGKSGHYIRAGYEKSK